MACGARLRVGSRLCAEDPSSACRALAVFPILKILKILTESTEQIERKSEKNASRVAQTCVYFRYGDRFLRLEK